MDFAHRYVTVADPLTAFKETCFELAGLSFACRFREGPKVVPLQGWGVDELQRHIVELLHESAAVAEGDGEMAPHLGDDYLSALSRGLSRAHKAFHRRGYLGERRPTPIGLQPGAVVVQHVVNELVVHTWDLATSMNVRLKYPDWLPERSLLSWQAFFDTFGRPAHNFDPEQPAPPNATAATKLAAYLGRKVPDIPAVVSSPGAPPRLSALELPG